MKTQNLLWSRAWCPKATGRQTLLLACWSVLLGPGVLPCWSVLLGASAQRAAYAAAGRLPAAVVVIVAASGCGMLARRHATQP